MGRFRMKHSHTYIFNTIQDQKNYLLNQKGSAIK